MVNKEILISARQVVAGRGLLNWTQQILAQKAGVGRSTVRNYESGRAAPRAASLTKIQEAFVRAGLRPLHADEWGGEGVRLVRTERVK